MIERFQARLRRGGFGGQLAGASAGVLVLRVASLGLAFVTTVILARTISPSELGIYAWATSVVLLLQAMATVGFDALAVRELGAGLATQRYGRVAGLLRSGFRAVGGFGVFVGLGALAVAVGMPHGPRAEALLIVAPVVPILAITVFRQGAAQGLGHVVAGRIPDDLARPVLLLAFVVVVPAVGARLSGASALLAQNVAMALACLGGVLFLHRLTPSTVRQATPEGTTGFWIRKAFPFGLINFGAVFLAQAMTVLLGVLSAPQDVAAFAVASRLAVVASLPEMALNSAFMPTIAKLYATGEMQRLRRYARSIALGATVLCVVVAAPMIAAPRAILSVFGNAATGYEAVLPLLAIAWILNAVAGTNGSLLTMCGATRPAVRAMAVSVVANVALGVALIPPYGATGAAFAWLGTIVLWNGLLALAVRRHLGFWATPFAFRR